MIDYVKITILLCEINLKNYEYLILYAINILHLKYSITTVIHVTNDAISNSLYSCINDVIDYIIYPKHNLSGLKAPYAYN